MTSDDHTSSAPPTSSAAFDAQITGIAALALARLAAAFTARGSTSD